MKFLVILALFGCVLAGPNLNCGQRPPGRLGIVNGTVVQPHAWPWMVSIHLQKDDGSAGSLCCGGAIIDKRWILTAGHCKVQDIPFVIFAGSHNLSAVEPTRQIRKITKMIRHEGFKPEIGIKNDVAVAKLDRDLEFNDYVSAVCVAKPYDSLDSMVGKVCTTTGWGYIKYGGPSSSVLLKFDAPVIAQADCAQFFHQYYFDETMICSSVKGKEFCNGDSGGPMNCLDETDGRWYTHGIVSWNTLGDCKVGTPDVYGRVSAFHDWIWKTVAEN